MKIANRPLKVAFFRQCKIPKKIEPAFLVIRTLLVPGNKLHREQELVNICEKNSYHQCGQVLEVTTQRSSEKMVPLQTFNKVSTVKFISDKFTDL